MGTTLREIVEDIGGGIVDGRPFKAVQTGGPSGGCIPAELLDMPVDYESLAEARLDHGLGRHDRHGRDRPAWSTSPRFFMDFCRDESCGKCIPCRVGTVQLHRLLDPDHRGAGEHGRPRPAGAAVPRWSADQPVRPRPGAPRTRCSARCATSARSTSPTSSDRACPAGVCPIAHRGRPCREPSTRSPSTAATSPARTARPILEVARENGIDIPTLCHLDGLSDVGACRLCLVEVRDAEAAAARLHDPGRRGHGGDRTLGAARRVPADDRRAAVRRAQPRLLGVRGQRPLRAAGPGRAPGRRPRSSCRLSTRTSASTPPTRCSRSTTTAASCAPAACGSATRSRAPTPGTSWAAASTRGSITDLGTAVGRVDDLHQLRQVRPGLPDRRAVREGPRRRRGRQAPPPVPARTCAAARREATPHEPGRGSPRSGSTAAPAATCRSSTWTSGCSSSPSGPTSSTAR